MARPDFDAMDLYARLGIPRTASLEEVKRAYHQLLRDHTPEHSPEIFKRIREAYETLSNPHLRSDYDNQLPQPILQMLDAAAKAMTAQEYAKAEQLYKQVIVEVPHQHWVRNLLGLCFLHQRKPDQAIAQYERILREGSPDATTHANAAQAYRMAKRYPEAEREYRTARQLGGERSLEWGLDLVDTIGERDLNEADKAALAEANAAVVGSPAAIEYHSKRVELGVVMGRKAEFQTRLMQVARGLATDEQKARAAASLGRVSWKLILRYAFEQASAVAKAAKALRPADPDYDGLEEAGRFLYNNDFDGIERLLNTHVSFARAGWLENLRVPIQNYCKSHASFKGMKPLQGLPTLGTINGIGARIYGSRDPDPITETYVVTQYFTVFYVPLFPVACYRVRAAPKSGWYFLGKVPFAQREKAHWAVFGIAFVILLLWAVATSSSPTASQGTLNSDSPSQQTYQLPLQPSPAPYSSNPYGSATPSAPFAGGALAVYDGEAVNTTAEAAPIKAAIRLTITSWSEMPSGSLEIQPPLGGSGLCVFEARDDSVRMGTVSTSGDTILWLGTRSNGAMRGDYLIVGGQYKNQRGTWRVAYSSGTPIPRRMHSW